MTRLPGVVALAALAVTGCAALGPEPSPTTTHTDALGEVVTVDWAEYPGNAYWDGALLLGQPDHVEAEPEVRAFLGELAVAIEAVSGDPLRAEGPAAEWYSGETWFPQEGNGYGGESLLVNGVCCPMVADAAPGPEHWAAVIDAASQVTAAAGFGPLVLRQDSAEMRADPLWWEEYRALYCTLEDDGCWLWYAQATNGAQWVSVEIQDATLDPTGEAATTARSVDGPPDYIRISYGGVLVRAGLTAEYERAMQPFLGLERPKATEGSD